MNNSWIPSETLYRPPTESESVLLEVSRGCTYGKCSFCHCATEDSAFTLAPLSEIERQLEELAKLPIRQDRVFFTGGNAFNLHSEYLRELFYMTRAFLPQIHYFSMYARVADILAKTPDEIIELRLDGLSTLYVGVESGSDSYLRKCRKGTDTREMLRAFSVLDLYGIPYGLSCIIGLGGKGTAEKAAAATASFLNKLSPESIRLMRLTPLEGTELERQIRLGEFIPQEPKESLLEEYLLLKALAPKSANCLLVANHLSNSVPVAGFLPRDKSLMMAILDDALRKNSQLRDYSHHADDPW